MESKDSSFPIPLPQLLRHRNVPDVPEDVDYVMQHLNDPNWEMDQASPTASVTSFPMEQKGAGTTSSGHSIHSTDLDSESQVDSTYKTRASSRAQLQEADLDDFNEYVHSPPLCFRYANICSF